ncbi:MAG: hypothetical protein K8S27_03000 [Candidatus Omnitrophica bacterium]|nr:hypothetical protein [Candidatus Omnitrophota bacterium]
MLEKILQELKKHAPFTSFGAITGIIIMAIFYNLPPKISYNVFYILHPIHVVLSAMVTVSMYRLHQKGKCKFWSLIFIGYVGSVGIATLSDSIIPYLGEMLLGLPNKGIHIGFIEKWWLVNPLAFIGVAAAYFRPTTKFPHSGHVLLSTWASLFHIIMATGETLNLSSHIVIFLFLFIAVWIPCCLSDIIFPLLFVREE